MGGRDGPLQTQISVNPEAGRLPGAQLLADDFSHKIGKKFFGAMLFGHDRPSLRVKGRPLHKFFVDEYLQVAIDAVEQGALVFGMAQAIGEPRRAHVEVDRVAMAIHQVHIVKKTGRAAAAAHKQVQVLDRAHLLQRFALDLPEIVFAFFPKQIPHIHARFLLDIGIEVQEMQVIVTRSKLAERRLASTHESDHKKLHAAN